MQFTKMEECGNQKRVKARPDLIIHLPNSANLLHILICLESEELLRLSLGNLNTCKQANIMRKMKITLYEESIMIDKANQWKIVKKMIRKIQFLQAKHLKRIIDTHNNAAALKMRFLLINDFKNKINND